MNTTRNVVAAMARAVAALIAYSALLSSAQAQPTEAQQDAIRHSCRSDYIAHCMSVPPGGADALHWLQRNVGNLSSPCQTAVNVTMPKPTPADSPTKTPTQ